MSGDLSATTVFFGASIMGAKRSMVITTGTHATVLVTGMAFGILKAVEVELSTTALLRSFPVLHVVVAVVTIPNKRFNVPGQQCK